MSEGIRDDLGDVASALDVVRSKIEELGEAARAVNGLGNECSGWADRLATMIAEVKKESIEVPAKLLGTPIREITQSVNPELASKVKAAKGQAA